MWNGERGAGATRLDPHQLACPADNAKGQNKVAEMGQFFGSKMGQFSKLGNFFGQFFGGQNFGVNFLGSKIRSQRNLKGEVGR